MVEMGAGTPYAKKYVMAAADRIRREIIPACADECAKKRAEMAWSPQQYRACLRECIKRKLRELSS